MNQFWEFKAAAPKKGELYLYGPISDSSWFEDTVSPAAFQKDLAKLGDIETLDIFINSPGGDVFAGIALHNIIKRHPAFVNVHIDGIAASAASVVAMAGDKIIMPAAATMMIHNASGACYGNKKNMRYLADALERIDGQLSEIYAGRTGKEKTDIAAWMDAERWMSGVEAMADGFADELEENKQIAACGDTAKFFALYQHPPEPVVALSATTEAEETQAADKGGISNADNGAETQPVADKLGEQRRQFKHLKLKLLEEI